MRRAQASNLLASALVLALGACEGEDPCAALSSGSAPHLPAFERFVEVAERVADADSAFTEPGQLEESLFVSLRRDPAVLAAWVERSGAAPLSVTLPSVAPPIEARFVTCRPPGGGRVEVARGALQIGEAPGPALFLRRVILRPPQSLSITVAFVDDAPERPR